MFNQIKGQAVIEAAIVLPAGAMVLTMCLFLSHAYMQRIWVDHHLYQALLCSAARQPLSHCREVLVKKIKTFLWLGKIKKISIKGGGNQWKGKVILQDVYGRFSYRSQIHLDG